MTAGTALLTWAEPQLPNPPDFSYDRVLSSVLSEVAKVNRICADDASQPWHRIVISQLSPTELARGEMLSATTDPLPYHFLVHANGTVKTCLAWRNQQELDNWEGSIRVGLADESRQETVSYYQLQGLRALVEGLQIQCSADKAATPLPTEVIPSPGWPQSSRHSAHLIALLKDRGIIG